MKLSRIMLGLGTAILPLAAHGASNIKIEGSGLKVLQEKPEASTGLNDIFIVYDTSDCRLTAKVANGYTATVYRYSNLGGGYAEEITDLERSATEISIPLANRDMGYIIEENSDRYYCWVVNYSAHEFKIVSLTPAEEPDCDYIVLNFQGEASPITYYTINGQPRVLNRDIKIEYDTQEFDRELNDYVTVQTQKEFESLGSIINLAPPAYCSTYFTLYGDRFLEEWGMGLNAETGITAPFAVECQTEAIQEESTSEEGSNVMKGDDSGLGGSAPASITFYSYCTEGVMHYEWQMSRTQDFENPEYRFYQKDLEYTFHEEGTFYLRFIASNSDGSCEAYSDTYTVSIGASALECPNAFSPNDDGVNDIWKVSYRSLIDFHCEIFNRNGQRIFGFDDPSAGWDGTWHGKKVKSGVYYYVITATGADGKKYKKSGDINIINSINYGNGIPSYPDEGYPGE